MLFNCLSQSLHLPYRIRFILFSFFSSLSLFLPFFSLSLQIHFLDAIMIILQVASECGRWIKDRERERMEWIKDDKLMDLSRVWLTHTHSFSSELSSFFFSTIFLSLFPFFFLPPSLSLNSLFHLLNIKTRGKEMILSRFDPSKIHHHRQKRNFFEFFQAILTQKWYLSWKNENVTGSVGR